MFSLNFFKLKSASSLSLGPPRTPGPSKRRVRKPDGMLAPRPTQQVKFVRYIAEGRADHFPTHNPHYPAPHITQHTSASSLRHEGGRSSAASPNVPQLVVLPPSPDRTSPPSTSRPTTAPAPPIDQQGAAACRSSSIKDGPPPKRSNAIRRERRGPNGRASGRDAYSSGLVDGKG